MISKKEKIAILHMLAIKESLTSSEFSNVLREVQRLSFDSFFSNKLGASNVSIAVKSSSSSNLKPKSFEFILKNLRVQEPEKYELLQQLKLNLRSGAIFKNFSDLKDLMAKLDQVSLIGATKAATVNNLLIYLSKKKSNEIRDVVKNHMRPKITHDDKGFNDLANYIIDPQKK